MYDIEDRSKTFGPGGHRELRQNETLPIQQRMREYLDSSAVETVLPKEKMGSAIGYLSSHGDAPSSVRR